ncbi:hypothetical protein N0V88_000728 [Collariella sp. IMI 366227]|nr:hypothetical protein N0V88_000728 [Collariella sp. IMI 366227]
MMVIYASPPQQMARSSASPNPSNAEHHLVAGMSARKSHGVNSQTKPYPAMYHAESRDYPSTPDRAHPPSLCSTTLGLPMDEGIPTPPSDNLGGQYPESNPEGRSPRKSPSAGAQVANKSEEPYAKLIYRALLSASHRAMTLQEIYQWFRENTSKGKDDSKGWQSSIRHNLSLNLAFTNRERKPSSLKDGDADGINRGKTSEWFLEPWATTGVKSTSRYFKSRRSATTHGCRPYHNYSYYSRSGILSGRRPAPLRSPAVSPSMQAYHFTLSSHHHNIHYASRAPFIYNLINDLTSAASTTPFSRYTPSFDSPTTTQPPSAPIFYDHHHYPTDPQLFPSTALNSLSESEDFAVKPEPGTPEHTGGGGTTTTRWDKLIVVAIEEMFAKTTTNYFTQYYQPLVPFMNSLRKVVFPGDKP